MDEPDILCAYCEQLFAESSLDAKGACVNCRSTKCPDCGTLVDPETGSPYCEACYSRRDLAHTLPEDMAS